jgi:hypothetical protein
LRRLSAPAKKQAADGGCQMVLKRHAVIVAGFQYVCNGSEYDISLSYTFAGLIRLDSSLSRPL